MLLLELLFLRHAVVKAEVSRFLSACMETTPVIHACSSWLLAVVGRFKMFQRQDMAKSVLDVVRRIHKGASACRRLHAGAPRDELRVQSLGDQLIHTAGRCGKDIPAL